MPAAQHRKNRLDYARNSIDKGTNNVSFLDGLTIKINLAQPLDTRSGNRGIVNILNHIDADNNLILAIRVDYLNDAFMRFNCLSIGLRIVSQLET